MKINNDNFAIDPGVADRTPTYIVLSGGGAVGWWQWRFLMILSKVFNIVMMCGTSAGALNTFAYTLGYRDEVTDYYREQFNNNARGIFKPGIGKIKNGKIELEKFKLITKLILNKNSIQSIMTAEPLIETLTRFIENSDGFDIPPFFNMLNMTTGKNVQFGVDDAIDYKELIKGVAASANIPILLPLIPSVNLVSGEETLLADAGLRDGAPLAQMFDHIRKQKEPAQVIVLSCNTVEMATAKDLSTIDKVFGRVGSIFLNENLDNDLKLAMERNEVAKTYGQALSGYAYAKIGVAEYDGVFGSFSFTPEAFDEMEERAQIGAAKFIKSFLAG